MLSGRDRIVVFVGSSLAPQKRPADPRFAWRPPAVAGDALALLDDLPRAVVLIDGLFDERPAIRHKELLLLIAQGVPVIGGASMGALRAAELDGHGMIGVGRVYAAFASGRLDGDDEVAVLHGPAEWDWAPLTEALVNVRATVLSAVRGRVVDGATGRAILGQAAGTFYKERTWPAVLAALTHAGRVEGALLSAFEAWLATGYVDLKHIDALACLERALVSTGRPVAPPPYTLFTAALREQVARQSRCVSASRAQP